MHNFNQFGIAHFIAYSDGVARTVAIILIIMSIASWSVMLLKAWRVWHIRRKAARFSWQFWNEPAFYGKEADRIDHPYARLADTGVAAAEQYAACEGGMVTSCPAADWLGAALRNAIAAENARLETGLTVLASVGSTAPFVGLFGTVWGIYHALIAVGASGQATLSTVAGPVGEALIMTALGLAVAIPAVLGYNALLRSNRIISASLNTFAYELMAWLMSADPLPRAAVEVEMEPEPNRSNLARAGGVA